MLKFIKVLHVELLASNNYLCQNKENEKIVGRAPLLSSKT
jgi:hypothetical protein